MEWRDYGVILSVRKHGEASAIAELLTPDHGRCLGLVRGGRSRIQRPMLQPGNFVQATWRARLEDHLGTFVFEPLKLSAGTIMESSLRLLGLMTMAGLAQTLPEREPHEKLYNAFHLVLDQIDKDDLWPAMLVRWEMGLLDELGFGLDLSKCAVTGATQGLCYVSPKSGRAVTEEGAGPYREKLLRLPGFLTGQSGASELEVIEGFRLTGHFLERDIFGPRGLELPESRVRLLNELNSRAQTHMDKQ
jgi:DNA repair protein RecO (recombination protein O)